MLSLKTKLVSFLMPALVLVLPLVSSAQTANFDGGYFTEITTAIKGVVDAMIPIFIGILVIVFAWGVIKYIWGAAQGKDEGKKIMIWGVVGIAVVVSVWGLVNLLQEIVGVTDNTLTEVPRVPDN